MSRLSGLSCLGASVDAGRPRRGADSALSARVCARNFSSAPSCGSKPTTWVRRVGRSGSDKGEVVIPLDAMSAVMPALTQTAQAPIERRPTVARNGALLETRAASQQWSDAREADLSAKQARAQAAPWLPPSHEDGGRPDRARQAPGQGSQAPVGLSAP